ncbi:MAG: hypothetical protein DMF63_00420 [Acidobacteria bacterium]|nr:MAG: hypothetical protein DMF63_00420 [Acidobacteriota bacterium]
MQSEPQKILELQVKVSKILGVGFIFSIVWVAGVGSFIAVLLGVYARKLIKGSDGQVAGIKMAWWCIIVGMIGTIIMPIILFSK